MKHRIAVLQSFLREQEAVFLTYEANRRYYTGFPSSAGILIVTKDRAWFLIDFRYYEKASAAVTGCEVMLLTDFAEQIRALCGGRIKTVYLETETVSVARLESYRKRLPEFSFSEDDALQKAILRQRRIKNKEELACMRMAQSLTDETFSYILPRIEPGRTEREIQLDMEFFMRKNGSEGVAFDFIVLSGSNTSLPHGVPGDRPVCQGDLVTMDFGAVCGGYRSDMTRTVAVGKIEKEERRVYETVLSAQNEAFSRLRPGAVCREVDKAARDYIAQAGYEGNFGHGLGHSVGLEIHENPACNTACEEILESGVVMTVEPGIYLPGRFGVRIEDMAVITDNGYENFTKSPKNLIVL
ncbi:MAG: aminopeptidase P family protein [Clostridia bacterium]|nr:aminopeptidase P family protein [Clostridia bacterium]